MVKCEDKAFVKITNQMIYKKLCDVESHVQKTNGKVKLNKWIATTALTLAVTCVFAIMKIFL